MASSKSLESAPSMVIVKRSLKSFLNDNCFFVTVFDSFQSSSFIALPNHILAPYSKAIHMISTHLSHGFHKIFVIFHSGERPSYFKISSATTSHSCAFIEFLPATKKSFLKALFFGTTKPNFPEDLKIPTIGSFLWSIILMISASFFPLNSFTNARTVSPGMAPFVFHPYT